MGGEATENPGWFKDLKSKKSLIGDLLDSRAQRTLVQSGSQGAADMDNLEILVSLDQEKVFGHVEHLGALRSGCCMRTLRVY